MVNVGDRGSLFETSPGTYANSIVKDGFDDFALLLDPPHDVPGDAEVWIWDGRLGKRYRNPNDSSLPLRYVFDRSCSENVPPPGGLCGAGGKSMIGDAAYPDLMIGCPGSGTNARGMVWILDMKMFDVKIGSEAPGNTYNLEFDNPNQPLDDANFGNSVAILGHFAGGNPPQAEVLIGEPNRQQGASPDLHGRVHYIDLSGNLGNPQIIQNVRPAAACFGQPRDVSNKFGAFTAVFGDVAMDSVGDGTGAPIWGEDGIPDIVVGDPFWTQETQAPNISFFNGSAAWYNSANLLALNRPAPMFCATGGGEQEYLGYYVCAAGDRDNQKGASGTVTASWDFFIPKGTAFRGPPSIDGYYVEYGPVNQPPPPAGFYGWGSSTLFPHWRWGLAAEPTFGDHAHAIQLAAVGDIDLDAVYEGHDDYAFVKWNDQDAINNLWYRLEVIVADGASQMAPPATIFSITRDPTTNQELLGIPTNTPFDVGSGGVKTPRRTTVSPLGDVDGDGIDDFGIVSGYSTSENYADGEAPTHGLFLVLGSAKFPASLTIPGGTPTLNGNSVAQRGSRIAMRLEGLPPNASIILYEDTALLTSSISYPGCQGTRYVGGTQYNLVADANGDAFFVRDLVYKSTNPNETTSGTAWYYQAEVSGYSGMPSCKMSNVRTLHIVDSSYHLDQYLGDS